MVAWSMRQAANNQRAWAASIGAVLLIGLLLFSRTAIWSNVAHLQVLHARPNEALATFAAAVRSAPDDMQIRWQYGATLLQVGRSDEAIDVLMPLLATPQRTPDALTLLFTALATAGRAGEIPPIYERYDPPLQLSQSSSALVALTYLDQHLMSPHRLFVTARALGLLPGSPSEHLLGTQMSRDAFAGSETEVLLRRSLAWIGAQGDVPPTTPVAAPDDDHLRLDIAGSLHISASTIALGPELVVNGGFEAVDCRTGAISYCTPDSTWSQVTWSDRPANKALFVAGVDVNAAVGTHTLRIDGLLIEQDPTYELARAGYWHAPIMLTANAVYLITFFYRTYEAPDLSAAIWLTADPHVIAANDTRLPSTGNLWRRIVLIGWNRSPKPETIQPLLRSFSKGSVWFDNFSIRQLTLPSSITPGFPFIAVVEP